MPPIPHERPCRPSARGTRPLPDPAAVRLDPAAVRLCLIPDWAPPYDPEIVRGASGNGAGGAGPLLSYGGGTAAGPPPAAPSQTRAPSQAVAPSQAAAPSQATAPSQAAAPSQQAAAPRQAVEPVRRQAPGPGWPSRFAQVLAETLAGSRPARQLTPWTTERARDHIQRLGPRLTSSQQPRVRRVVTSCPAADVMEMSVVVGFGAQIRALAIRLERSGPPAGQGSPASQARWLCTAVEAA
jgi:hypothetical protein